MNTKQLTNSLLTEVGEKFTGYNWNNIAKAMGMKLVKKDKREVVIHGRTSKGFQTITLIDNSGEINVSYTVPFLNWSVPFASYKINVGDNTLAYRLAQAIQKNSPIDYDLDLDTVK